MDKMDKIKAANLEAQQALAGHNNDLRKKQPQPPPPSKPAAAAAADATDTATDTDTDTDTGDASLRSKDYGSIDLAPSKNQDDANEPAT